ncbi:MAG: TolC family protein [Bryobacteraceae bacterium]|nr:TolC family protein [Bryobacteraceae bacterium]
MAVAATALPALLLFALLPAAGQTKMSLAEALELAERENPALKAAEAAIAGAAAGVVGARAYPNPSTSSQTGRQMVRVPGNVTGLVQILSFLQPLELGPLRPTRIALAEKGREVAETQRLARRVAVLSQVRRTFFEVLRRDGEIEILTENLALVEALRKRVAVRVEVGEAARLELVRADAEVASARAQVNAARIRRVAALAAFRAAVGAPLPETVSLAGGLESSVKPPALAELEKQVVEEHPALRLARGEKERARSRIAFEKAQRIPQPVLRTDYERYPDVPNFRVGIDIPLPLWNRREGPIAEAEAAYREAEANEQLRRVELLAALEGAYRRLEEAEEQIRAYEKGVLPEAEAALRAAQTAFQLGERGILEVLDAQRLLRSARIEYLNAQFDRQAALVDLDELRGVDPLTLYRR